MQIADTFNFLLGTWTLERSIADHRSRRSGAFSGRAVFVEVGSAKGPVPGGRARYGEEGVLRIGTYAGPASRRLGCTRLGSGAVMLYFADGRPFLRLDLRRGAWRSTHECGDDRYEVETVVQSESEVQESWRVRGPGKSYDAFTTLVRAG